MIVTLIVPIYNGEKYLAELFDSILAQNSSDFEVLLINDGSSDNTREICMSYCRNHNSFRLINQENKGLSSARNRGIEFASSKYIWFVDADDKLEKNSVSLMTEYICSQSVWPDILFANADMFSSKGVFEDSYFYRYDAALIRNCDADSLICYLWSELDFTWSVWRNWFRTDFIKNNSLYYDENQPVYEATDWLLNAILSAKHYDALQQVIYHYRIDNEESIMHKKFSLTLFFYAYNTTVKWYRFFEKKYAGTKSKEVMRTKFAQQYRYIGSKIPLLSGEEQRKALMAYKNNIDIAAYMTQ